ncbi:alanine racemase [Craterilacuibacter sp. RT1T]|uniref:alanine racemase n=1 Tax=Craterilacuibacter sp. RT1T TaxID=2942211 RepID=UPI0020BFC89B|nr:alanine racemase [Craterilacuibacter sp. RT1T]MCL6263282.1 alanine racemase [Craterilacuibacter sp. RT1T]
MKLSPTLLALSLGFVFTQGQALAAPPLSISNGISKVSMQNTNAWVEIDQAALDHNLNTLKAEVGSAKICAILKADAYGHGVAQVMPSIIAARIPCVGIASNEEARVVRASGYKGKVMRVRTGSLAEVEDGMKYNMEELVGNIDFARTAASIAKRHGKTLKVHVALNSAGMSRNGIDMSNEKGRADVLELVKIPGLKVAGIMTHFPIEDKAEVEKDLAVFKKDSAWLIEAAGLKRKDVILHCANSFATLEVPESRMDMVRPGGAIYGDTVPTRTEYKRIMALKSRVASVNPYPAGNTVGYDRTYTLKRNSLLANIPMGYSDGYRRVFTNKGHVLINGQRAPVVGKVSMNTTMVDVTDIPGVKAGDEVVLFGKQGSAEVTQAEMEEANGALLADLYTVWGNSNPKLLVNTNKK